MKLLQKFLIVAVVAVLASACNNYGKKLEFNGTEVYYTENATEEEAQKLGEFLNEQEFTDGNRKSVQLNKEGDKYQFRMVTQDDFELDDEYLAIFKEFGRMMSEDVFSGEALEIHLCDNKFNTKKVIEI